MAMTFVKHRWDQLRCVCDLKQTLLTQANFMTSHTDSHPPVSHAWPSRTEFIMSMF